MKKRLIADELNEDPRIQEAKRLIVEAVHEHQNKLDGPLPPVEALTPSEDDFKRLSQLRGGNLFYRYLGSGIGKGSLVELIDGSVKLDFITGIGVHCFGHSNLELLPTMIESSYSDVVMQGNLQQNIETVELSELLTRHSGLDICFLSTSGAMANENALKILFQKQSPRSRLLAFDNNFMGRTIALSASSDRPQYRKGLPKSIDTDYIPFFDSERPEESTREALSALKKILARYPNSHAAMSFELIQGEGGFKVGQREFYVELMKVLKEHDIHIHVDEVQTFGRTQQLFAFQHFGLEEYVDVVSIGKLSQICATLYRKEMIPGAGLLSQTFTSSTSAIRSAIFVLKQITEGGFYGPNGRNQQINDRFQKNLERIQKKHPGRLHGLFGVGAMIAFQIDEGDGKQALKFLHHLFDHGLLAFSAGSHPTRIRFLVPLLSVTDEEIDQAMDIVEKSLEVL